MRLFKWITLLAIAILSATLMYWLQIFAGSSSTAEAAPRGPWGWDAACTMAGFLFGLGLRRALNWTKATPAQLWTGGVLLLLAVSLTFVAWPPTTPWRAFILPAAEIASTLWIGMGARRTTAR